jgi:YCII-related domain
MANYLLAYNGGSVPETDAEREAVMVAWTQWFGNLGQAVVDPGNPFGPSKAVGSDGSASDGAPSGLTGYSVVTADSLDAAAEIAKGCPVLTAGGNVEVYETLDVM